jgi:hypothetical protein
VEAPGIELRSRESRFARRSDAVLSDASH